MSAEAAYLDTSAFVKLLVAEPESGALRERLRRWPHRMSSDLLRTEAVRALRRSGNNDLVGNAKRLMAAVHLVRIDAPLLDVAGDLRPAGLRSLDAIHLATALAAGRDLAVFVTYDTRLAEAATAQGFAVEGPAG